MYLSELPDSIGWTASGLVHVVEAKVSRADFLRDAKKWHRKGGVSMGHRRWFVAPRGLIRHEELGDHGLLEPSGRGLKMVFVAPPREQCPRARREAHSILRNAIVRHEKGIRWHSDAFRFDTIEQSKAR